MRSVRVVHEKAKGLVVVVRETSVDVGQYTRRLVVKVPLRTLVPHFKPTREASLLRASSASDSSIFAVYVCSESSLLHYHVDITSFGLLA